MDNTVQDYSNIPTTKKKSVLPIIIAFIILIAAVIGGIFLLTRSTSNKKLKILITPTIEPTTSPIPTPITDKESIQIQVLNGTSTPGQASKVAVTLKNAGYNLDNIKTGNSSEKAPTSTIAYKTGFKNIAENIQSVLTSSLSDIEILSSTLDLSSEFDVIVTTGGVQYATPTPKDNLIPTLTPTGTAESPTPTITSTPTPSSTPTPTP